ncbi:tetratricopeptide repeat protein [Sedimentitalea sp. HM32M-2]|uniref:tetratricopeptide repeat protein n=1 Tax=Sedimentitalea sp. HM32M-2 TaxID=3351566 RepID=UPI00362A2FA0
MSDTDSFIEEVTEEVRRDRLFIMFKRYGWIAALVIVVIVGGAAYNEYRKAQARAAAQQLGDDIITALGENNAAERVAALGRVQAQSAGGAAVLGFLTAATQADAGETEQAVAQLNAVAGSGDLPEIYRQIAAFKALTLQAETLPANERRLQFEALAQPGAPLRLLAQEQLALIDIGEGQTEAAIERLQTILRDAEATPDLQQRVSQVIVALGGNPDPAPLSQG